MRAVCSICSDLYEDVENHPVAAITGCGHTFHDSCLKEWLTHSATCPQCRKRVTPKGVLHKLFFVLEDHGDHIHSPSKLTNEIGSLKASLRTKDQKINELEEKVKASELENDKLSRLKAKVEKALKGKISATAALKKECLWLRNQQDVAQEAIAEAARLKEKLEALRTVQNVVQGLEEDVEQMITGQNDIKQLATWSAVLKKELSTKRIECKHLKEKNERFSREAAMCKRELNIKKKELQQSQEQTKASEEELKETEKENASLKKKLNTMKEAMESPSGSVASSFAHRLMCESPAPMPLAKRPKLIKSSCSESSLFDLNVTPDLFPESPDLFSPEREKTTSGPSPMTQTKRDCREYGTQFIKFSKAASNIKPMRDDSGPSLLPKNMNIFKKPAAGSSGMMSKGYNGLGGHSSFVKQPSSMVPRPAVVHLKKPSKSAKMRNLGPAPALPTLNM